MYKLLNLGVSIFSQEPILGLQKSYGNTFIGIPMDESNTDYQAFLAWKEQGNEPLPAEE